MLDLGVEFAAKQDHDGGDPHPHHHADYSAERPIGRIVCAEIGDVPGEENRALVAAMAAPARLSGISYNVQRKMVPALSHPSGGVELIDLYTSRVRNDAARSRVLLRTERRGDHGQTATTPARNGT
jgi:hypothetical protein